MSGISDEKISHLVLKLKQGDDTAYGELYKELWKPLFFYASQRLGAREDAKDAVQETMIEVYRSIGKLKNERAFESWINRILIAKCSNIRGLSKKVELINIDEMEESIEEEYIEFLPEEILTRQETCKQLTDVISQLPVEQKDAVLLYYFRKFSTTEISKIMNISTDAVKQKLFRARKTIKNKVVYMQKQGFIICLTPVLPVLTRIFMENMKTVCTYEVEQEIFANIQASLLAGGGAIVAGALATAAGKGALLVVESQIVATTTTTAAACSALSTGLVMKVSASLLTIVAIGGRVAIYVDSSKPTESVAAIASVVSTATPESIPMVKSVETLDDIVGKKDADNIRSWSTPSTKNQNEELIKIVEEHGLKMHSTFVDTNSDGDMYMVFVKGEGNKRLLICEFYNATTEYWAVVYSVDLLEEPIPRIHEISEWFEKTKRSL